MMDSARSLHHELARIQRQATDRHHKPVRDVGHDSTVYFLAPEARKRSKDLTAKQTVANKGSEESVEFVSSTNDPVEIDEVDAIDFKEELAPLYATNHYTVRKMAAQKLMDVALMMANISQLHTLMTAGSTLHYRILLLTLVAFSLVAQIVFAILIFMIWMDETDQRQTEQFWATMRQPFLHVTQVARSEQEPAAQVARQLVVRQNTKVDRANQEKKFRRLQHINRMNCATVILAFSVTIANMFISGFGIKLETFSPSIEASSGLN